MDKKLEQKIMNHELKSGDVLKIEISTANYKESNTQRDTRNEIPKTSYFNIRQSYSNQ